jgi:CDGSH-type Zn-finger protein/uncharacterized Fe-S cluster protein YjdI
MMDDRDPGAPPNPPASEEPAFGVDRGDRLHEFHGEAITVTWSRRRCIHVAACVMNLPRVFEPGRRPWVDVAQATADAIARVVAHCPTGALHCERTDGGPAEAVPAVNSVVATRRGPLHLRGDLEIFDESGARRLADTRVALCRCGRSGNKPFCDGSHSLVGFGDDGAVRTGPMTSEVTPDARLRVKPEPGGPLHLEGPFSLASADRRTVASGTAVLLCRCGRSGNKPFCDGSHRRPA